MSKFQARTATPEDAENYVKWLEDDRKVTVVDKDVYAYPTCNTVVVERDGEVILIDSFHIVMIVDDKFAVRGIPMCEALALRPGLSDADKVESLRELYDALSKICTGLGLHEIWCQTSDPRFAGFLTFNGFKVMPPAMKLKITDNWTENPLAFLVAQCTRVMEIFWHPVDDEHAKHLSGYGFKPVTMPIFSMVWGSEDDDVTRTKKQGALSAS
jgi:hypothetical protein